MVDGDHMSSSVDRIAPHRVTSEVVLVRHSLFFFYYCCRWEPPLLHNWLQVLYHESGARRTIYVRTGDVAVL